MERELTELQERFLDALFNETNGDIKKAIRAAGYSEAIQPQVVLGSKALKDAIIERAKDLLAYNAPKAVLGLTGLMDDPSQIGAKTKMDVATKILDRVGIGPNQTVQVESETMGVFFLPKKDDE